MSNRWKSILCVFFTIAIFVLAFYDLKIFPSFIYINLKDHSEVISFYSIIFQVQATIAVLSPTLISLLSVFNRDKYHGISISKFIMFIRPGKINYSFYTLTLFIGILLGLGFLLKEFYNCLTFLLLITTLICWLMAWDCLYLFRNGEYARQQLSEYVVTEIYNGNDEILDTFNNNINESLLTNNYVNLVYDIEVLNQVFFRVLTGNNNEQ